MSATRRAAVARRVISSSLNSSDFVGFAMMLHTLEKAYPPAGRCIYCNKTSGPLSREHIIPYALGGRLTLPKATCPVCQKITCRIEDFVARRWLGRFRKRLTLPSQTRKSRQETDFDVRVHHHGGAIKMVNVDIEDYPRILGLPVLPEPAMLGWAPTREPSRPIQSN